jgi:WD40 repeat protein
VGVDEKSCHSGTEIRPKGTFPPSQFLSSSLTEKRKPLTMSPVNVIQCHTSEINDISVNSSGGFFVTAGSDCAVKSFEMSTGRFLMDFNSGSRSCPVICVDISRGQGKDDQWAVGGGGDGSYRVWNLHTGALRLHLTGHAGKIYSCSILGETLETNTPRLFLNLNFDSSTFQ